MNWKLELGIEGEVAAVPRESGLFTTTTQRHKGLLNNPQISQVTQIKYSAGQPAGRGPAAAGQNNSAAQRFQILTPAF